MNGKQARQLRKLALSSLLSWTQVGSTYNQDKRTGQIRLEEDCFKYNYKQIKKALKRIKKSFLKPTKPTGINNILRLIEAQYIRDMIAKEEADLKRV